MELLKTFIIADFCHLTGEHIIEVYEECENAYEALVTYLEDERWYDIPEYDEGITVEENLEALQEWCFDCDHNIEVKEL